jgi:hypothetical protein
VVAAVAVADTAVAITPRTKEHRFRFSVLSPARIALIHLPIANPKFDAPHTVFAVPTLHWQSDVAVDC